MTRRWKRYARRGASDMAPWHRTNADRWGRLPGTIPGRAPLVVITDFGYDVPAFNRAHGWEHGCQLGRTVGSDTTMCDTHGAYVSHGIPVLLRTSS